MMSEASTFYHYVGNADTYHAVLNAPHPEAIGTGKVRYDISDDEQKNTPQHPTDNSSRSTKVSVLTIYTFHA